MAEKNGYMRKHEKDISKVHVRLVRIDERQKAMHETLKDLKKDIDGLKKDETNIQKAIAQSDLALKMSLASLLTGAGGAAKVFNLI